MLFDLPVEILAIVVGFLDPDHVLKLQALTRIDILKLYRYNLGYCNANCERDAFELFREKFFMRFMYRQSMRVPREYTASLQQSQFLLDMVNLRGVSSDGHVVMAVFQHRLLKRVDCNWPVFVGLVINAIYGQLEQLSDRQEEAELAIALVQFGMWSSVRTVLELYQPQTLEMVKAMLHFGLDFDLSPDFFQTLQISDQELQDLCDYWFLRRQCDSQKWLVNNLPESVSIKRILITNAGRFFFYATKATIGKFGIIENRRDWTMLSGTFFPALFRHRKKFSLLISALIDLSYLHIRQHGRIDHLLVSNPILLRSRLFRPPMSVLEDGARHHDQLFALFLDRIPFLTKSERQQLRTLVEPSIARPTPPLPGYTFVEKMPVNVLNRRKLLNVAFAGNVVVETVV